jgi:UDP-N-acetylmuramate dehydrogenase
MLSVIRENVRLAPYTTLRIGGIARYFADIDHEDQLREALQFAEQHALPTFVLGGGSNVLIADAGFPGLVIHIVNKGIAFHKPKKDAALVTVAAGEEWDGFVQQCVARGLAGVECLSGIPGLVGGTPIQNVGAYGQEVSETIVAVRAFDRGAKRVVEMTNADCQFTYRASVFNTSARDRYVVLGVTYKLRPHGAPALRYPDLQKHFARHNKPPTLQEVREAVIAIRASKGMVLVPNDPDCQSAGSFFKNPLVSTEKFAALEAAARHHNRLNADEHVPQFAAANGQVKIPAAWLIERAGFAKGYERGRVGISSKHTLALINRSNATASELVAFVAQIQHQVQERFGLALVPEPVWVGLEPPTLADTLPRQPVTEVRPPETPPAEAAPPPAKPGRKFRKPGHNPLKTERKKWFE